MRKVIPYIASGFRKDKIWLRRTKPSKRQYQILLAVDDSSSMADNRSRQVKRKSHVLWIIIIILAVFIQCRMKPSSCYKCHWFLFLAALVHQSINQSNIICIAPKSKVCSKALRHTRNKKVINPDVISPIFFSVYLLSFSLSLIANPLFLLSIWVQFHRAAKHKSLLSMKCLPW